MKNMYIPQACPDGDRVKSYVSDLSEFDGTYLCRTIAHVGGNTVVQTSCTVVVSRPRQRYAALDWLVDSPDLTKLN